MARALSCIIAFTGVATLLAGPARAQEVARWSVSANPSSVIGADDRRVGHALFRVKAATRLHDGRIVIADGGSSELRFFSADGALSAKVGGQGRGPEQFRYINSVARSQADTILVLTHDPALAWVAPNAKVVRKIPLDVSSMTMACRIAEGGISVLSDGTLLLQAAENKMPADCGPQEHGLHRLTDVVARYDPRSRRLDTLGIFPGEDRDSIRPQVFGRALAVASSDDRIFVGETGEALITVFTHSGAERAKWRVPLEAVAVSRSAKGNMSRGLVRRPDGTTQRRWQDHYPERYPRMARLLPDALGYLWVMKYPHTEEPISSADLKSTAGAPTVGTAAAEWLILDRSGAVVATARTPGGMYVLEIGSDYVLGLARDELDVESVRLYALQR